MKLIFVDETNEIELLFIISAAIICQLKFFFLC